MNKAKGKVYLKAEYSLRNMVSSSSLKLIEKQFNNPDEVIIDHLQLGYVVLKYDPRKTNNKKIVESFEQLGFPIIKDKDDLIVEEIKQAAIELIHFANNANSLIRNSDYISDKLLMSYSKLSKIFSNKTGTTLEKYLIQLKIEKIKELITYNEHSLSEIAFMMGYSSVQYLSNQFKKMTGLTVSTYKNNPSGHRIPIDQLPY
jgi:AraC family transcriptional regulator